MFRMLTKSILDEIGACLCLMLGKLPETRLGEAIVREIVFTQNSKLLQNVAGGKMVVKPGD